MKTNPLLGSIPCIKLPVDKKKKKIITELIILCLIAVDWPCSTHIVIHWRLSKQGIE